MAVGVRVIVGEGDGVEVGVTGVFVGMGKGVSVDDRSWTGPVAVG